MAEENKSGPAEAVKGVVEDVKGRPRRPWARWPVVTT